MGVKGTLLAGGGGASGTLGSAEALTPAAGTVSTPVINPAGGTFLDSVNVTLSCGTAGAETRYTTDNSDPTATSTLYTSALTFTANTTLKARGFEAGMTDSDTATASFTIEHVDIVTDKNTVTVPEGSTATVQVKLSRQPAGNVTVNANLVAGGDADITIQGGASLSFTTSTWDTYQAVTLAAAEDLDITNGSATVRFSAAAIANKDVTATEQDNDTLNIVTSVATVAVSEGGTATFRVKLSQLPPGETTVSVARVLGDGDISVSSGANLTFTTTDWDAYQTVTLAAAKDFDTLNGTATIRCSSPGLANVDVTANEVDNDTLNIVTDKSELTVVEGQTASFQVKLSATPAADVIVTVARTSGDADISVSGGATLTFTSSNWSTYQTVTVTAALDTDAINGAATVRCSAPGVAAQDVTVTEQDINSAADEIIVTTTMDDPDVPPPGSLRLALLQVIAGKKIKFDDKKFSLDNSEATTRIRIQKALPPLDKGGVIVDGQARKATLVGNDAISYGLRLKSNGNTIMGLSIVGFQTGVLVDNCANNVIGGSRNVGVGADHEGNGQGMRISGNSENGIMISGDLAQGNTIKGCWIGVDISGSLPDPNGATGIHVSVSASNNTIGGTAVGEQNVISGNRAEGIVFSEGASLNKVFQCHIGMDAHNSSSLPNGSDGIFVERGSSGNTIGGDNAGEGNVIANNGRSGVKIRDANTIRNSVVGNSIYDNLSGGITLRDSGNGDVQPPTVTKLERSPVTSRAVGPAASRAMAKVTVGGTASRLAGAIHIYSDSEVQGRVPVCRTDIVNSNGVGTWQVNDIDISDLENITATFTDADGNTSPFAAFGRAPALNTPAITSAATASATVGVAFNYTIAATNSPTSFGATGLPDGLKLDTATGAISGSPTGGGTFAVQLSASNAFGAGTQNLSLTVSGGTGAPLITSAASASGGVGAFFAYGITAAGATPMTFGAQNLPPGLAVNESLISGTPSLAGTFAVVVTAANSFGTATSQVTMTIAPSAVASDSDGDGVADALETLAGTDPSKPSDVPVKEGAIVADKISLGLSFTSGTKDGLKATLRLALPAGYVSTGSSVAIQFADYTERFTTLDAKGKSPKGLATLSIKGAPTTPGPVTGGQLSFSVKGKDLKTGLASAGLLDKTTAKTGETLSLPVAAAIGMADGSKHVYIGSVNVVYKAVQGKSGKAAKAKY